MKDTYQYSPDTIFGKWGYLHKKPLVEQPEPSNYRDMVYFTREESNELYSAHFAEYELDQERIKQSIVPVSKELYDEEKFTEYVTENYEYELGKDFFIQNGIAMPVDDIVKVASELSKENDYEGPTIDEYLITDLTKENEELKSNLKTAREAIEYALRIKELWVYPNNTSEEHRGEAEAIAAMASKLEFALKNINL